MTSSTALTGESRRVARHSMPTRRRVYCRAVRRNDGDIYNPRDSAAASASPGIKPITRRLVSRRKKISCGCGVRTSSNATSVLRPRLRRNGAPNAGWQQAFTRTREIRPA